MRTITYAGLYQNPEPLAYPETPTEALRCKLAAVDFLQVALKHPELEAWANAKGEPWPWTTPAQVLQTYRTVSSAPLLLWGEDPATVVALAAEAYPRQAVPPLPLQCPRGFAVFTAPLIRIRVKQQDVGLSALSWEIFHASWMAPTGTPLSQVPKALHAIGWVWAGKHTYPLIWGYIPTPAPAQTSADFGEPVEGDLEQFAYWVLAAESFMLQRLLVSQHAPVERHARKTAARLQQSPTVQVLVLRRVSGHDTAGRTDAEHRSYSVRWLVAGHWRNQWHPHLGEHRRRWIAPYAKGPLDKPFKAPLPRVFAVTR